MLRNSVVARTSQAWKLVLAIVLMVVGSFAPMWEGSGIGWTLGTIIVIVGYAFALWFIVCPSCGNRWFWSAALDATLYGPLFKRPACPACKQEFDTR